MIFHTTLQWFKHQMNQSLFLQNAPLNLPYWARYGVSVVRIFQENWSCLNGTTISFYIFSNKFRETRVNTLRLSQNGHHFANDIFKCIFLNENVWISIKISPKFIHKGPIDNIPGLVQRMAWRRPGDKPLSEPMMVWFTDAYMRHWASMS